MTMRFAKPAHESSKSDPTIEAYEAAFGPKTACVVWFAGS